MATAGSKEARELEKVKRSFDKAYKEVYKATNQGKGTDLTAEAESDTPDDRYSLKNGKDIENILKEKYNFYKKDEKNLSIAKEALNDLQKNKEKSGISYSISQKSNTGRRANEGNAGIRTVGKGITTDFINKGRIDFRGREVNSPEDVAELCQVFRDPRFETFRIIYVKRGKVVSTEGITSRMPGSAVIIRKGEDIDDMLTRVERKINKLNADGIYIVHNHPSGDVTTSGADTDVTKMFGQAIGTNSNGTLLGHVIINHNKFGYLDRDGNFEERPLTGQLGIDSFNTASIEHPLLGKAIRNASDIADISKALQTNKDVSVVLYLSTKLKVRQIQEISDKIILNDNNFKNYLRNQMRESGSNSIALATYSDNIYNSMYNLIDENFAVDILKLDPTNNAFDTSARADGMGSPIPGMWAGLDIHEYRYTVGEAKEDVAPIRENYSLSDSTGRQLTKGQAEYFKDSKVRDDNGNLIPVYHGTNKAGFTVFNRNINYYSDEKGLAETYSNTGGLYEGYLNIKNPLVIDVRGEKWSGIPVEYIGLENTEELFEEYGAGTFEEDGALRTSTADITSVIDEAIEDGKLDYDGVIFKNIYDEGSYGPNVGTILANDYVTFNKNQFKNITNQNPTDDPDIRYSLNDSNGNELSPIVEKRFANSKARDENGDLKVLYHGSIGGDFTVFDKTKGNVEGDFGSGFYFTDNEYDVETNYEGGGPDFNIKVERLAEQIEDEQDIDFDEAKELAKNQLFKGSNKFEVYLNIEHPAIVGETTLLSQDNYLENYNPEDYDSEEEYYEDVEQLIADDIENIVWEVERNIDLYNTDGLSELLFEAYYEGGIGVQDLKEKINELYLETENGELAGNEITRQIIESMGYDGIIDPTVSKKFRNMGIDATTTHYIVFKPNQIKLISNENPTDDPDIRRSLSEAKGQSLPAPQKDSLPAKGERVLCGATINIIHQ